MAEAIEDAFKYDKLIIATPTYDAGLFPTTELFLSELKHKNYQGRRIGIIENGSWAPMAAKCIEGMLKDLKDINICNTIVTIKTTMTDQNEKEMEKLVEEIINE